MMGRSRSIARRELSDSGEGFAGTAVATGTGSARLNAPNFTSCRSPSLINLPDLPRCEHSCRESDVCQGQTEQELCPRQSGLMVSRRGVIPPRMMRRQVRCSKVPGVGTLPSTRTLGSLAANAGWVSVGPDHDTAAFAG